MSRKIGQVLIDKGFITSDQLRATLKQQLIFGGQLGTNLLELEFLSEVDLGRALAEAHGVPCAPPQAFEEIPQEIIDLVPEEMVRARRLVPFGVEQRSLHLAMVDPRRLSNLSSSLGYRILPYIAPEKRILQSMEKYYGIPRPMRYIRVSRTERRKGSGDSTPEGPATARSRTAPFRVPPGAPPALPPGARRTPEMQSLSHRMSAVASHGELGDVILDFAAGRMERCVLFGVEEDNATVANWKGIDLEPEQANSMRMALDPRSIFALTLEGPFYHGAVPDDLDCADFFERLGIDVPQECLFLPIYGDERLEAVIYGDGGDQGRIEGNADTYHQMLELVSMALKMLSIRQQLAQV